MLVAWVYVIPPLQGRLTDAEARGRAQQRPPDQRHRSRQWLGYDTSTGQLHRRRRRRSLDRTLSSISTRSGGRVHRLHAQPRAAQRLRQPGPAGRRRLPDARASPSPRAGSAQGTVTTARGRVAATAVPLSPADRAAPWSPPCSVISSLERRGQRGGRGAAPAAARHGPGAGHQPRARLHGLVLHRPPAEAHRAQRRAHRRRRPLGQGARRPWRTRSGSSPTPST